MVVPQRQRILRNAVYISSLEFPRILNKPIIVVQSWKDLLGYCTKKHYIIQTVFDEQKKFPAQHSANMRIECAYTHAHNLYLNMRNNWRVICTPIKVDVFLETLQTIQCDIFLLCSNLSYTQHFLFRYVQCCPNL